MSIYVDLHQNDLSLTVLRQYLQTGEEIILTDMQQLIARITTLTEQSKHSHLTEQSKHSHLTEQPKHSQIEQDPLLSVIGIIPGEAPSPEAIEEELYGKIP